MTTVPEHLWVKTAAGIAMPPIIYGTAWKKERTADLVETAVLAGFRGIDTAGQPKHYEEPLVGEALQRLGERGIDRREIFLQTKFTPLPGQDPENIPFDAEASPADQLRQSLQNSLKNLQTTYVDSYILHSPLRPHDSLMEVWRAMETLYKEGVARQLGISNCYAPEVLSALCEDAEVAPAVVQNRFHAQTGYDAELRTWCSQNNIYYQSFWTLTANPHILASAAVRSIARDQGMSEAQVFFRYLTQAGITPLTGTTSTRHMQEDLDIFKFELNAEQMRILENILS